MLLNLAHRLVANPMVYDAVQVLAGANISARRLRPQFEALRAARVVLDVGGGTGWTRTLWPGDGTYICLDTDPTKLRGYRRKWPDGAALLGDAARLPIADRSVDLVTCVAVFHHLTDAVLAAALQEFQRVLRSSGVLLCVEPLWAPSRPFGRLLWRYDRGAHPRSNDALRTLLERGFAPLHTEQYAIWHEYLLWLGRPRSPQCRQ